MRVKQIWRTLITAAATLLLLTSCVIHKGILPELHYSNGDSTTTVTADNHEGDDSYSTATLITPGGSGQNHTISREGDIDWLKFNGTAGLTYRINLSGISGFEPELSLYQPDGTTLIEMKNTGTYTGSYDWWGYNRERAYLARERESITFTPVADGTYFFSIKDIYDAHSQGRYKVTVTELIIIEAVTTLNAAPNETTRSIDLNWSALSGVEGYNIYRTDKGAPGYNDFTLMGTAGAADTTYSDSNILLNTAYTYYIAGFKSGTVGEPSPMATATLTINIQAPLNLQAAPNYREFLQIDLSWSAPAAADGYNIYYKTAGSSYLLLAKVEGRNSLAYSHKDVVPGTAYEYRVNGYILNSEGAESAPATATYDWAAYTPSTAPITASENLTAMIELTLAQKQDHSGIVRYDIYRTERGSAAAPVKVGSFQASAPLGSKLDDNGVTSGKYYDYSVKIVFYNAVTELESGYSVTDSGYAW